MFSFCVLVSIQIQPRYHLENISIKPAIANWWKMPVTELTGLCTALCFRKATDKKFRRDSGDLF
jgi:hypothetical protein